MSKPAIKVEGLFKEYAVGHAHERHDTFYELLTSTLKAPLKRLRNLGGQAEEKERFWALQDVNFEVKPGEVVGIISRNGAGKSTLLKILSRITAPTKGRIEVRGRLASLLEVGTGFHPELSGRENIYLNGAILGMTRKEVARKFDAIVAFAEIEKFIDTPVKRYSSGMYVRLAFAVAAYLEPDILVVDEVLAVGDFAFQEKCLGKMRDVSGHGRTVLFVSHNMPAVQSLCSRALLLCSGTIVSEGPAEDIIGEYLSTATHDGGMVETSAGVLRLNSATGECKLLGDREVEIIIKLELEALDGLSDLTIDFGLENKNGLRLLQIIPLAQGVAPVFLHVGSRCLYQVQFKMTMPAPGDYFGTIYAHSRVQGAVLHQSKIHLFRVFPTKSAPECMSPGFTALLLPSHQASISLIE